MNQISQNGLSDTASLPSPKGGSKSKGSFQPPKIGVVGHSRAGKSTFLAVLKTAFERVGWAATVRSTPFSPSTTEANTSRLRDPAEYVAYLRRFVEAGFFPPSTRVQDTADRVSFEVARDNNRFEIDCFDPAGEVLEGDYDERSAEASSLKVIQQSLEQCAGVLLLLDPETHPDLWLKTWERVEPGLNTIRPPRVAVCFAKADIGVRQRRFRVRDARSWVKGYKKGLELLEQIQNRNLKNAWYFVSATGWLNGSSNIRVFVDARPIRRIGSRASVGRLRELVPDPAQRLDGSLDGDDAKGYRYMQNLPIFTDPLRLRSHDFRLNPMTDAGPMKMLSGNSTSRETELPDNVHALAGVHVGYGRGGSDTQSRIRPWNVVEPVLWLADLLDDR
jgi:hypothetical protein